MKAPKAAVAVVDSGRGLSPGWFTAALQYGDHDLRVVDTSAKKIGTGQMGTTYRVTLTYEGPSGPPTLVVKLAGADKELRKLVAPGYAAEIGFYRHLAEGLDIRIPRCWFATKSIDDTRFTLVLDDLAPAEPGVQADGCSVEQAHAAIQNLVGLHVPHWGDASLADRAFLMRSSPEMAAGFKDVLVSATEGFLERYDGQLGDDDPATLRAVASVLDAWQLSRLEPSSVVHGDYRLDNLLFSPDGTEVTAVDWQSAAIGPPLRDVAYFLGTSLPTEARREHEQALVADYHAAVVARGVTGYDAERCWTDYRFGQLQGPMIGIIGCMYASGERTERSDAMFIAMATRSAAAIRDLGSLDLL